MISKQVAPRHQGHTTTCEGIEHKRTEEMVGGHCEQRTDSTPQRLAAVILRKVDMLEVAVDVSERGKGPCPSLTGVVERITRVTHDVQTMKSCAREEFVHMSRLRLELIDCVSRLLNPRPAKDQ